MMVGWVRFGVFKWEMVSKKWVASLEKRKRGTVTKMRRELKKIQLGILENMISFFSNKKYYDLHITASLDSLSNMILI